MGEGVDGFGREGDRDVGVVAGAVDDGVDVGEGAAVFELDGVGPRDAGDGVDGFAEARFEEGPVEEVGKRVSSIS